MQAGPPVPPRLPQDREKTKDPVMTLYGNRPPAGDEGFGAIFNTVHDDCIWFVRAIYLPSVGAVQYGAPPEVIRTGGPKAPVRCRSHPRSTTGGKRPFASAARGSASLGKADVDLKWQIHGSG